MLIAFREWRRTRPFWGGLLIAAGAAEILSTTVLSLGPTFRVGLGGVNAFVGDMVTVVLGVCGLLLWFSPAQRVFYSIVSVILALATFNTINYGGFFLGMLLGIVGGAMAFAWSHAPVQSERPGPRDEPGRPDEQDQDAQPGSGSVWARLLRGWFWRQGQPQSAGTSGRDRVLTIAATPLAGLLLLAPALPGHPALAHQALAHPASGCILIILCPPTKSPSPSPSPSSSSSGPGPSHPPSPSPRTSSPGVSPSPPATPGAPGQAGRGRGRVKRTAAPPGLVASAAPAVLTAGTARLAGLAYDGVAEVPRSSGGPVAMMKFTLRSVILTGNPTLTIHQNGSVATTTMSLLSFSGNVVLYATRLSGDLLGADVTITASSPLSRVVRLLRPLTRGLTVTMTHVVASQPIALAATSRWDDYHISVG